MNRHSKPLPPLSAALAALLSGCAVEVAPPPMPFAEAVWTGGYWTWQGNWVCAAGRWAAPGVVFVPPPPTLSITVALAAPGVVPGPRPIGPAGVFVPAPPGLRAGLIVPAPIGTSPSVVVSAPPVTQVGMRVLANVNTTSTTNINNVRVTNITNVTNVTVVAPAGATTSARPYEADVPAQAPLAAALPPVVRARAPTPLPTQAVAAYEPGRVPQALPQAQAVRAALPGPAEQAAPHREPVPATERAKAEKGKPLAEEKKKLAEEEAERRANGGR